MRGEDEVIATIRSALVEAGLVTDFIEDDPRSEQWAVLESPFCTFSVTNSGVPDDTQRGRLRPIKFENYDRALPDENGYVTDVNLIHRHMPKLALSLSVLVRVEDEETVSVAEAAGEVRAWFLASAAHLVLVPVKARVREVGALRDLKSLYNVESDAFRVRQFDVVIQVAETIEVVVPSIERVIVTPEIAQDKDDVPETDETWIEDVKSPDWRDVPE